MRLGTLACLLLASCRAPRTPPRDPGPVLADMTRSAGGDDGGSYRLTVHENGVVIFQFLGQEGEDPPVSRRLSRAELGELARAFERVRFTELSDYDQPSCRDYPVVEIEWRAYRLVHFWSDRRAPLRLYEIEATLDRIAGTHRWLGHFLADFTATPTRCAPAADHP